MFFPRGADSLAREKQRLIKCENWPKIWLRVNSAHLGMSGWLHNWPFCATEPPKGMLPAGPLVCGYVCWDIFYILHEAMVEIPLAKYNI